MSHTHEDEFSRHRNHVSISKKNKESNFHGANIMAMNDVGAVEILNRETTWVWCHDNWSWGIESRSISVSTESSLQLSCIKKEIVNNFQVVSKEDFLKSEEIFFISSCIEKDL